MYFFGGARVRSGRVVRGVGAPPAAEAAPKPRCFLEEKPLVFKWSFSNCSSEPQPYQTLGNLAVPPSPKRQVSACTDLFICLLCGNRNSRR